MLKRNAAIILTTAVLLSVVFINLISLNEFVRVDLTKDKKYTLSQASRETMEHLEDVMVVTAYFTEGLPAPYASYSRYVQDLLEEYRAASKGKLSFEFLDPTFEETADDKTRKKTAVRDIFGRVMREPTSVEAELMELGVEPVEIRMIEDDQQQTKRAYMGLVLRYQGKQEVIGVVQDVTHLEKEMTLLMRKLVRKKTPIIALVGDTKNASLSKWKQLASESVQIKEVQLSDKAGELKDADGLMVVGDGENLSENAIKEMDQFLREGKGAAFLMDRFQLNPQTFEVHQKKEVKHSPVFDLLSSYGVEVGENLVADTRCATLNMSEQRNGMLFSIPIRYPFIPEIVNIEQDNPLTHGVAGVMLPFASSLQVKDISGLKTSILAQSGKVSWLETVPLDTNPRRKWRSENVTPTGPYPLLAELKGKLNGEGQEMRVLVAGTSAFVWDQFFAGANQALALNLVDWLVADAALLSMRTRALVDLPLDPEIKDETRAALKYGNIIGVPALLVIYGLLRWRLRERRRRQVCRSVRFDNE